VADAKSQQQKRQRQADLVPAVPVAAQMPFADPMTLMMMAQMNTMAQMSGFQNAEQMMAAQKDMMAMMMMGGVAPPPFAGPAVGGFPYNKHHGGWHDGGGRCGVDTTLNWSTILST
jgi:hypothetical protein